MNIFKNKKRGESNGMNADKAAQNRLPGGEIQERIYYVCDQLKEECDGSSNCAMFCFYTSDAEHAMYETHIDFDRHTIGNTSYLIERIRNPINGYYGIQ